MAEPIIAKLLRKLADMLDPKDEPEPVYLSKYKDKERRRTYLLNLMREKRKTRKANEC